MKKSPPHRTIIGAGRKKCAPAGLHTHNRADQKILIGGLPDGASGSNIK
jgi:hypothetical protein